MSERDWLHVGCAGGHDWASIGGKNAGCHEFCVCSVPVMKCRRCGDCDYGDNTEARITIDGCAATYGTPGSFDESSARTEKDRSNG